MKTEQLALQEIYKRRFGKDLIFRQKMWEVLCKYFFQKQIPDQSVVLEVAAGYCEFINAIHGKRKIAVDLNRDTNRYANADVEVQIGSSNDLSGITPGSVDVVFVSNFFEHLSHEDILITLGEILHVLKQGGKLLILQPNYRFCFKDYWMFFDHITPIDDRGLVEALETHGYEVSRVIPRFLPFTTKSALPKSTVFIRVYLLLPFLWNIFGAQCFIAANKQAA